MAATRKRKQTEDQSSSTMSVGGNLSIRAFGIIGKHHEGTIGAKKQKLVHTKIKTQPAANPRKRSATALEGPPILDSKRVDSSLSQTFAMLQTPQAAQNKRTKLLQPPSPHASPRKTTAALLGDLRLDAKRSSVACVSQAEGRDNIFPQELDHLCGLYTAFWAALSMYYAHNGYSSPVSTKALLPMITSHWRRRAVSLKDIRLILAIAENTTGFELRDFGRGGISLVRVQSHGRQTDRAFNAIDEQGCCASFEATLRKLWVARRLTAEEENCDVDTFIARLPLLPIHQDENPVVVESRGKQRLADFKLSQNTSSLPDANTKPEPIAELQPKPAAQDRGTSLLDRILAKQAHTASLPAGPTKAQLERKAALHRIEDIARVLELLAGSRPRCSFSMQAIVQQLRQSMRNPIAKDEVERCLTLMATEITPGFVSLLKCGTVTGVVVTKGGKVELGLLRLRIERASCAL